MEPYDALLLHDGFDAQRAVAGGPDPLRDDKAPIRVLMLEDSAQDAEENVRALYDAGLIVTVRRVESRQGLIGALKEFAPDILLTDCVLPNFDGLSAVKLARELAPGVPVIAVTGVIADRVVASLLHAGAHDYVLKDRLARLGSAVRRAIADARHARQREQAEKALGAYRARFQALVENMSDVIGVLGADGRIRYVSPSVRTMAGYDPAELVGRHICEVVHPEERGAIEQRAQDLGRAPNGRLSTTTARVRHKDGSWITVETSSVNHADTPAIGGIVVTLRDVTKKHALARALQQSETLFRQLAENVQDVFYVTDAERRRMLYVSPAYEAIWGRSREVLYQSPMDWLAAVHPDDRAGTEAAFRASGEYDHTYRIVRPDGGIRWIHARAYSVRQADGSLRSVGTASDITLYREQQQKIERLNRVHAVLSGINGLIVRARTRAELFQEACDIAAEKAGFVLGVIGIVQGGTHIVPVAHHGRDTAFLETLRIPLDPGTAEGQAPLARAAAEGQAILCNDLQGDPGMAAWHTLCRQNGYGSCAAFPLTSGGQVVGAIAFCAKEVDFFDTEEMSLLSELASDISYSLEFITKGEKLDFLSIYDPLTRLPNRVLFTQRLDQYVQAAREQGRHFGVLILDVAGFKHINDLLGQAGGDELLQALADRLRALAGDPSFLARIGGDQFAIVLDGIPAADSGLPGFLEQVEGWGGLEQAFQIGEREVHLLYRLGCAAYPGHGTGAEQLLRNAEAALKSAKAGGNRLELYTEEMSAKVAARIKLEGQLRRAIRREEFVLHYQPKVDLQTNEICGAEALLRWNSPERGLLAPAEFLATLEDSDMIIEVGRWALEEVVNDFCGWAKRGFQVPRLSVNVARRQIVRGDFADMVREVLADRQCALGALELEITETIMMSDVEGSIGKLRSIRDLGVHIALDDFGTGYSSLAHLARLPLNSVKIDRSFVQRMTEDPDAMAIVSTIVTLAHSMKFRVVAEGVAAAEQVRVLQALQCDEIQGFLYSEPVPAAQFEALLRSGRKLVA